MSPKIAQAPACQIRSSNYTIIDFFDYLAFSAAPINHNLLRKGFVIAHRKKDNRCEKCLWVLVIVIHCLRDEEEGIVVESAGNWF